MVIQKPLKIHPCFIVQFHFPDPFLEPLLSLRRGTRVLRRSADLAWLRLVLWTWSTKGAGEARLRPESVRRGG